jgi:hypothetical protein
MYGILYSCYSAACYPVSCLICRRRPTTPEAITPISDESPEDYESKYIIFDDQ